MGDLIQVGSREISVTMIVRSLARNKRFCDDLAKRLEIEGGGENPGDFVQFALKEWATEEFNKTQLDMNERFMASMADKE